jgi:hypothetical protein
MKRLILIAMGLACLVGWAGPSWALENSAIATTNDPVLNEGQVVPLSVDRTGHLRTVGSSGGGSTLSGCTPTAAAPTYSEGVDDALSCDLGGNERVTLGTLLSGEIQGSSQATSGIATGGMVVRSTTMGTAMVVGGDSTPKTAVALPVGGKTIYGSVDGTGAVTQIQSIYGGITSGVTSTTGELLCVLNLSGTTHAHASCYTTTPWLFYIVVTTNTTGTGATGVVTAMY